MAGELSIEIGEDGSANVVGDVDGAKIVFASVNPSQIATARLEQNLGEATPAADPTEAAPPAAAEATTAESASTEADPTAAASAESAPSSDAPSA